MDKRINLQPGKSISRQVSLREIFRSVRAHGEISRAELSRQTGFSKQTTSEVVGELLSDGWLLEAGQTSGNIGRAATNYMLNGARAHVFGCDLGGTKVSVAIADLTGKVVAEQTLPTSPAGGIAVVDQIVTMFGDMADKGGVQIGSVLYGALGAPGAYDRSQDRLRLVANIEGFEDFDIAARFRQLLGIPVFVENDVTMAAKGELWAGSGNSLASFAFMAFGTGIGLGIVSDGQVVRGARGGAGEIASLPIGGDPFDSRNFRSGTFENAISSAALVQRYKALGGREAETVEDIFDRLAENDPHALSVIDESARLLAMAIVTVCAIVDPEVIITGGSIGSRVELIDRIRAVLPSCTPNPVPLLISSLGSRAALVGAIGTALDNLHATLF